MTTAPAHVDALIIGSGQAAPALAMALAGRGESVALVEAHNLGGTCVNNGCTPTKTLRKSARVAHMVRRAAEFGVNTGAVSIDFAKAMDRMHERVNASRAGLEAWLMGMPKVRIVRGWGRLAGRSAQGFAATVDLPTGGQEHITADRVYLNTGTRPFMPPIEGMRQGIDAADPRIINNEGLLQLRACPQHLVILGGSYIGLEFGQIMRRLGAAVSIIEPGPRIAAREDELATSIITQFLQEEGVAVLSNARLLRVESTSTALRLYIAQADGSSQTIEASHLLVATGRVPNTDALGLESIGLVPGERGYIHTNAQLETAVPGVWALGDINGRGAFTHTSFHDYEIVRDNLLQADAASRAVTDGQVRPLQALRSADERTTVYAMFTDPPLGRVGMNRAMASAEHARSGRQFLIAEHMMRFVSRAKEESETHGVVQFVVDAQTEQFVGATVLGINGDEIIQVVSNYMATGASYRLMRDCLPAHPTVTEFFPTILDKLKTL